MVVSCILDQHQQTESHAERSTATGCTQDANIQLMHDETLTLPMHEQLQLYASQYKQKNTTSITSLTQIYNILEHSKAKRTISLKTADTPPKHSHKPPPPTTHILWTNPAGVTELLAGGPRAGKNGLSRPSVQQRKLWRLSYFQPSTATCFHPQTNTVSDPDTLHFCFATIDK